MSRLDRLARPVKPSGQRHFIIRDPAGVLIDVITPIPPNEEFVGQFAEDALPS
ncbi:hypothetical protein [Limimaricola sp. AA108-03]|uniref:hypothetical protein n=1 Tax=Limimaricola sp. AA108-03 TaxID=3425945 RepID=UPI003D770416